MKNVSNTYFWSSFWLNCNNCVAISRKNVKSTEKMWNFMKNNVWNIFPFTQFRENSKISIIFLIPCISIKHQRNGIPLNVTNIVKPKLIKILNLCPKQAVFLWEYFRACYFWMCTLVLPSSTKFVFLLLILRKITH